MKLGAAGTMPRAMPIMMPRVMSGMMPQTKSGKVHSFMPHAYMPKPNVEIKMWDGCTFVGQIQLLPIIHDDVPYLQKQQHPFQHYSVYIEMGTGRHYISGSLIRRKVHDSRNHLPSKATINLEATNHSATNFEVYDVNNPHVPNTFKYAEGSGLIYVAIKGTTKVYRAIVR